MKTRVLKLDKDDPQRELEFEVECELEIPPSERLERWLEWNIRMLKFAEENRKTTSGNENSPQVVKRP